MIKATFSIGTKVKNCAVIEKYFNNEIPSTIEKGYGVAESRSLEKIGFQLKKIYEDLLNG